MKRVVAMVPAAQAAAKEVHATPRTERKPRRVTAAAAGACAGVAGFAVAAAPGAAILGAEGAGGLAAWGAAGPGVGAFESSAKPGPRLWKKSPPGTPPPTPL